MKFANYRQLGTYVEETIIGNDDDSVLRNDEAARPFADWVRRVAPKEMAARQRGMTRELGNVIEFRFPQSKIAKGSWRSHERALAYDRDMCRMYGMVAFGGHNYDPKFCGLFLRMRCSVLGFDPIPRPFVSYLVMGDVKDNCAYIWDWWSSYQVERRPGIAGMTFAQAHDAAVIYHDRMRREAARAGERQGRIARVRLDQVRDADALSGATPRTNTSLSYAIPAKPTHEGHRYDLEDGYYWARLMTQSALDVESRRMGHCVGNGTYDRYVMVNEIDYGIWSLRKGDKTAVTVELRHTEVVQAKGLFNRSPTMEEWKSIHRLQGHIRGILSPDTPEMLAAVDKKLAAQRHPRAG